MTVEKIKRIPVDAQHGISIRELGESDFRVLDCDLAQLLRAAIRELRELIARNRMSVEWYEAEARRCESALEDLGASTPMEKLNILSRITVARYPRFGTPINQEDRDG